MKKITNKILIAFLSIILIVNIVIVVVYVDKIKDFIEEQTTIMTTIIEE